jgi:hypothetical protein
MTIFLINILTFYLVLSVNLFLRGLVNRMPLGYTVLYAATWPYQAYMGMTHTGIMCTDREVHIKKTEIVLYVWVSHGKLLYSGRNWFFRCRQPVEELQKTIAELHEECKQENLNDKT